MKSLGQIKSEREEATSQLFKNCGVFWAFSNEQFDQNKTPLQDGEKYVSIGGGGYLPKSKTEALKQGFDEINKTFKSEIAKSKDLRRQHIAYELANHESYYVGSIEDALQALGKGYSHKEVLKVYNVEYKKYYAN